MASSDSNPKPVNQQPKKAIGKKRVMKEASSSSDSDVSGDSENSFTETETYPKSGAQNSEASSDRKKLGIVGGKVSKAVLKQSSVKMHLIKDQYKRKTVLKMQQKRERENALFQQLSQKLKATEARIGEELREKKRKICEVLALSDSEAE